MLTVCKIEIRLGLAKDLYIVFVYIAAWGRREMGKVGSFFENTAIVLIRNKLCK